MARKISIVMDAQPVVPKPEIVEEVQPRPTYLPPKKEEEIDYDVIEEREAEIDELVAGFICDLIGADSPEDRDMVSYGLQDDLESLKDEFEEVLARHGIVIHRPTIVEDKDGNEVVVDSLLRRQLMKGRFL